MAVSAPRSILNPAGPLVRRQRADRMSARRLAALRQAVGQMQSDGSYRDLASLYAGRAGAGTSWFLGWNRAHLRVFEAAMLERVGDASLPWWDWTQQHEVPAAFSSRADDKEPNPAGGHRAPFRGARSARGRQPELAGAADARRPARGARAR